MSIDVTLYISHLLYRNNIAILPGFGAFVATNTPAIIDHARGLLTPPTKVLTFNENLQINDGFLINLIRQKHGISAHEARLIIENFVSSIQDILKSNDTVRLDAIGKLYLNAQNKIVFEPDTKVNFNIQTYGLPTVQYYALQRSTVTKAQEEKVVEMSPSVEHSALEVVVANVDIAQNEPTATKVLEQYQTTTTKDNTIVPEPAPTISVRPQESSAKRYVSALALIGLVGAFGFLYNKSKKINEGGEVKQTSSQIHVNEKPGQTQESSANDSLDAINVAEQHQNLEAETNTQNAPKVETNTNTGSTDTNINPSVITPSNTQVTPNDNPAVTTANETVLLVGSFSKKRNAQRIIRKLKRNKYRIYQHPYNGLKRVGAIIHFSSEAEKIKQWNRMKRIFGEQVWEME